MSAARLAIAIVCPCELVVLRELSFCVLFLDVKGQRSEQMSNLIYLGNYASVDVNEGDWNAENANALVGISRDHTELELIQATPYDGGDGVVHDDESGANDQTVYYIDGQYFCNQTDATMTANVTLTLSDGSTLVVEVVMMQQENGDLFISDLLNGGTLDNLEIANVEISEITVSNSSGWYSNQSVDNTTFAPVDENLDGTVEGTSGDDVIDGSYAGDPEGDCIDANDQILAGAGVNDDLVYAYAGDDLVLAGDGDDEVYGGTGNDTLCGQDGDDLLFGGVGNDILEGMNDNDTLYGGAGNDLLTGDAGEDELYGGAGDDSITGGSGNDVICGDDDEGSPIGRVDELTLQWNEVAPSGTEMGASQTYGVGGMDVTVGFTQQDEGAIGCIETTPMYVEAGENFDPNSGLYLYGRGGEGGVDNTSTTTLTFTSDDVAYADEVQDVSFRINDIDNGTDADDHIDIVTVRAYDADGNEVPVTITAESNLQIINGNTVTGGVEHTDGVTPDSQLGSVLYNIAGPVARIEIDYDNGESTDQRIDVTDINFFTVASDAVDGVAGDDVISGGSGDDLIYGKGGDDTVYGGTGNDSIDGGTGNDFLLGGDGNDEIEGGDGDDTLCGQDGDDTLFGGAGNDILEGMNDNDVLFGGTGDDRIYADSGDDEANGGDGNDSIYGGSGDDTLSGDAGADQIFGGSDADLIIGGAGDTVDGGAGGDDNDVLDLTGQGPFILTGPGGTGDPIPDSNGNGIDGRVVFVDEFGVPTGEIIDFVEIEQIIGVQSNLAPDAVDNIYNVTATEAAGDVDGNVITDDTGAGQDSDPEDDDLTVSAVDGVAGNVGTAVAGDNGGLFTINADGTVDFDANGDFDGLGLNNTAETSVTYTIVDEGGLEDTATATFVVSGINDGTVQGTSGNDIINPDIPYVDADGDIVDANDAILAGDVGNDDLIMGFGGDDSIDAGEGDDVVFGGTGSDVIEGGVGNDVIDAGNHIDPAIDYDYPGNDPYENDQFPDNDLDTVFGGAGDDIITTGDDDDSIDGGTGNDYIDAGIDDDSVTGGTGNDTIIGGQGDDIIEGNEGDDLIYGGLDTEVLNLPDAIDPAPDDNRDTLYGGAGNDTIFGRDDADTLFGGTGNDVLDGGIDDDLINGDDGDDTIYGGQGNDVINGGEGHDLIFGGLGDDTIQGNLDDDTIYGDEGNDTITGSLTDDLVFGGTGNDEIRGGTGDDTLHGDDGDDFIQGGYGADSITGGDGDDSLNGGFGDDMIEGNEGDDTIAGYDGNDTIDAGDNDDVVYGGRGDDSILGGAGSDTIYGGEGVDTIHGGLASDTILGGNGGDVVVGGEDPDDSDIDILDLTGSNVDYITYVTGDPEAGTVNFLDGTTMTFSEIENVIPCFTPGTTIATAKGERLVEELTIGDRIITRDNGIQEIAWVGHKEMTGKQLVQNPHLKPILIKAGALGNGLPERDMMVSPNHRVLVASDLTQLYFEENEVLAAAKHMVGANGIHAIDVMQTTYVHFMFERHEVILSNGAWTESFQPGDYSLKGIGNSQRNEIMEIFPELATKTGLKEYQSARKALKKHEAKLLIK